MDDFITITSVGTTVTTGAASANVTIPNASDNAIPRYVRIAATTESYIKMAAGTPVATTNDVLVQPADSIILQVPSGVTKIAYIQGTSVGKVNIAPLENL